MATKRPKLDKNKRVKAVARKRVGSPKPARTLAERDARSAPKHRKTWQQDLES